jgi:RNA binding exosome subunit
LDLVLDADGEYFARIDAKEMSLTVVSVGEGEDAIAGLEQVK